MPKLTRPRGRPVSSAWPTGFVTRGPCLAVARSGGYKFYVSTTELKRIVDGASEEEQQFLFVCLSEKLRGHSQRDLKELDERLDELEAGKQRLSLEEFEKRLQQSQ